MQRGKFYLMVTGSLVALALGYLVGTRRGGELPTAPVMKSYQVPAERANEVRNALNNIFWQGKDDTRMGHAQLFNGGILLVRAPEEIQAGVGQLIQQLSTQKQPKVSNIHIDYWLVTGDESRQSNTEKFKELSPVLSSITKADGPRAFRILEHLASNSISGQKVILKGSIVDSKLTAGLVDGHISLDTDLRSAFGDVESSTRLGSGEFIVLGENSIKPQDVKLRDDDKFKGEPDQKQINVYHILHAELLN